MHAAHVSGTGCTITGTPWAGLSRFRFTQGLSGHPDSRFRVAQLRFWIGSKEGGKPSSARCSRASPIKGTRLRG